MVGGQAVHELIVEEAVDIGAELYAAVLDDASSKGPLVLFSTRGGMDIEEVHAHTPEQVHTLPVDVRTGLDKAAATELLAGSDLPAAHRDAVAATLVGIYRAYVDVRREPGRGQPAGGDHRWRRDRAGRQGHRRRGVRTPPAGAARTAARRPAPGARHGARAARPRARASYIELDGDVGILANGAGLTMTTLDAVHHFGGTPANFLEIGGDAYTKATPALELVLSNPRVKSLLVNFCGAFARTDVMTGGVLDAIDALEPTLPIAFTIHGTGEDEAIALVRERLGVEPYDLMDDAVQAAVGAAAAVEDDA